MTLVRLESGARLGTGRYELRERIGRGGAATVWLADDTVLERPVAVKVLSESLAGDSAWLARFRREARLAAGLQHPNLVAVYDFEASDEQPYLVMAHMPGGSLFERIDSGEKPDAAETARDLLSAVAAIHSAGIIHRDIKPGNVLLDGDGKASLTDFGVARPEDATSLTQTGHIPGTGRYMAPELWRGMPADERTDLFATGMVLQQCLTPNTPAPIADLVGRLAADDRDRRPESAAAALTELGSPSNAPEAPRPAVVFDEPETRAMSEEAEAAPASRSPGRAPALAALAGVLAVVAIVMALAGGGEDPPASGENQGAAAEPGEAKPEKDKKPKQEKIAAAPAEAPADGEVDPVALDAEGLRLINSGRPEEAIPLLEQAVAAYPEGTTDVNYAFALYNLGNALYLAGRPDEAIPILEERLKIPNQQDVVQETLDAARRDAGVSSSGGESEDD